MKLRIILITTVAIIIVAAVVCYGLYSPEQSEIFPKCLFLRLTGLECPGCGSQRAIHSLLNLELVDALRFNPFVVLAIPYLAIGFWCQSTLYIFKEKKNLKKVERARKIHNKFYSGRAVKIVFAIIVAYFILRNIL